MSNVKNKYTVSAVIGEHRHWEYHIEAYTEKQAQFLFSAPFHKGGRANGFRIFDVEIFREPGAQFELNFD